MHEIQSRARLAERAATAPTARPALPIPPHSKVCVVSWRRRATGLTSHT